MALVLKLVFAIVVCQMVGVIGAFFTAPVVSSSWYAELIKPSFNPPGWIFPPVWIGLYALMAIAVFLVRKNKKLIAFFAVQLFFNGLWPILFFGFKNSFYAFWDIIILWILILVLVFKFFKARKIAGFLLVPYILWVSFALILNYYIWFLN